MKIVLKDKEIQLYEAKSFFKKLKGFMFEKNISHALLFRKCNGIHTFFMFDEIDVILTDKNNTILYLYPYFKKNRILLPKKNVYNTYELPKGSTLGLEPGAKIKVKDSLN